MSNKIKIAIDAMGGDHSPKKIIDGIAYSLKYNRDTSFLLFGDSGSINNELNKNKIVKDHCEIINTKNFISDKESPLTAVKKGKDTSMWKCIESQKLNQADISLSAGNTGALLVMSKMILNTIPGISKPALAALWPKNNGMNVVLDLGANVECNEKNLTDFVVMGASLYKSLFNKEKPNVALLNIGLEEIKGNEVLKNTFSIMKHKEFSNFQFYGYIEGNQIMSDDIDVIVTDGFTGNIALKTAEGTANFITKNLKESLNKISILFSYNSLKKFKDKLDPRKYNGAIFLGLQGPVVKSHGSTDYIGFSHSINVCRKIVQANLINKIKTNLIKID